MLPEYRTIYQGGEDEIVEKKIKIYRDIMSRTVAGGGRAVHCCLQKEILGCKAQLQRLCDRGKQRDHAFLR